MLLILYILVEAESYAIAKSNSNNDDNLRFTMWDKYIPQKSLKSLTVGKTIAFFPDNNYNYYIYLETLEMLLQKKYNVVIQSVSYGDVLLYADFLPSADER